MITEAPHGLDSGLYPGHVYVARPDNTTEFWQLPGLTQEYILLKNYATGKCNEIARLRPDFEIDRILTLQEIEISRLVWQAAKVEKPYTQDALEADNPTMAILYHGYCIGRNISKDSLLRDLERMRERRIQYEGAMFIADQPFLGIPPGIIYRGIIEDHLRQQSGNAELKLAA
jgi:hypothetical protein